MHTDIIMMIVFLIDQTQKCQGADIFLEKFKITWMEMIM